MSQEPENQPLPRLPRQVLYATSARVGGSGLDSVVFESLRALHREQILARALAYGNRQEEIPSKFIRSLASHPVRLLSFLESQHYYGAKRQYVDWVASRELTGGGYDFFHGWSGDCLLSLREARRQGVPCVVEIPTWHRNKGKAKPWMTASEKAAFNDPLHRRWKHELLVSRQRVLEEYDLADLILVLSEKAVETFRAAGIPDSKLFKISRGVDVNRFTPGTPPPLFRAVFVGALIQRKGVHHLLEAWHKLNLKNAELVLVGAVHEEIKPALAKYGGPSVRLAGFVPRPETIYQSATVHILPSSCEGSAKTTYEAAACGLAQIATRESGDVVVDGENGIVIPPDNVDALAAAIERLHQNPALVASLGAEGRRRMVAEFTWDHFRDRLLKSYAVARANAVHR